MRCLPAAPTPAGLARSDRRDAECRAHDRDVRGSHRPCSKESRLYRVVVVTLISFLFVTLINGMRWRRWARGFVFGQVTGILIGLGLFAYIGFGKAPPSFAGKVINGITGGLFSAIIWAMAFALADSSATRALPSPPACSSRSSSTIPARLGSFPSRSFGSRTADTSQVPTHWMTSLKSREAEILRN